MTAPAPGTSRGTRSGRNWLAALLGLVVLIALPGTAKANERYAGIVVDAETGHVLYEQNADEQRYPASLTKIMTLYLVFEALEEGRLALETRLKVSQHAAAQPPSRLGLKPGNSITTEEAILALVTKSANDAASVVAEHLGKSEAGFATLMTRKARELGMKKTVFRNASGLPDSRQVTTAREMVRLARAIRRDFPVFYDYFATKSFEFHGRVYRNHNHLLGNYPGVDGIKTGYIRASGFNLVATAQRDEGRVVGVVFGGRSAQSRDKHMRHLLDDAFAVMRVARPALVPIPEHKPSEVEMALVVPSAKPALAADPVQAANFVAGEGFEWSVQVGAFGQYASAQRRVLAAAGALPDLLLQGAVSIEPFEDAGSQLYRARVTGLTEVQAREACSLLEKSMGCLAVPPMGSMDGDEAR